MKYPFVLRAACAMAALGVAAAFAETAPAKATDAGPAPAEDRSSVGAIIMEPARAQRAPARPGADSVGRGVMNETLKQMGGPSRAERREQWGAMFNRSADGEISPQ